MYADPILAAFGRRLRRGPESLLVVGRRRETSVADIDRLRQALAASLARAELEPGSLVGLAAPNGPGFVAGFLALRHAACAALLVDARAPKEERRKIAEELGACAVLQVRKRWPQASEDFAVEVLARGSRRPQTDGEVAAVKLTSGTTGASRGIVTASRALVADDAALASTMGLRADERILASVPMSHSYGLSSLVLPALMRDAVLIVPDEDDPIDPFRTARERRASFFPTVPAFLQAVVRRVRPPELPSSMRLVVSAGAPLDVATAVRFREAYGASVHVFYGASECGGITYDRDGSAGERGSLGTPVEGVRVTLEPTAEADGGAGRVAVTSPAVAQGYLGEPDTSLDGGSFRTRDLGAFRGGELYLEARLDDLINVKGKKVNPREVESVLSRLEGVEEAVTLGVSRPGHPGELVRSFVVCRPGSLSYQAVQDWCRRHLAEHKVPRSIVFLDQIPKTPRGKLDRAALLALGDEARRG